MGRIVTPRVDPARFYRRGVKLDPSMQKKFGAQELQLLTKAIDAAVAIGGKIAGATQRRSAEMGAGREAREAAAREWGGMGGAKAMEAVQAVREGGVAPVSTQAAAAELASEAGVTAPAAAAPVEQFVAGAAPAPSAAAPAVPVQRRGAAPVVAQPGAPAPEDVSAAAAREAAIARMEGARADITAEPELVPTGLHGKAYTGLTPQERIPGPTQAHQLGPLADALGRAQALVHHANETGDVRHLDQAKLVFERVFEGEHGQITTEQYNALVESPITKAAFARVLPRDLQYAPIDRWSYEPELEWYPEGSGGPPAQAAAPSAPRPPAPAQAPTVTVPSPAMAARPPAPAPAPAAAPAPVPATSLEQQLMRERRAEVERESKRQQLFRPEALARMRPGELQAVLRFAKTPQEAVAVMRAVRESPDVQPTALSDLWTDGHVKRAQKAVAAGWKPPAQKDPGAMSKRLANIRNIESNIEYRNQLAAAARAKAERAAELHEHALRKLAAQADRAERKLKGASRRVIRRDPEGSQILLELNEHRKHYVAYTEGTGEWSEGAIYNVLASRGTPPPGGWTPEEISDERERLWRQKVGDLYGETAESAEMATLRRLGGSKGRKALRKIVTGTADDIFRASKEANLVTRQEAKIGQADERLLQSDSRLRLAQQKAADSLSRAELDAIQSEAYAEAGDDLEEYSKAQARLIDEALEQKRAAQGGGEGVGIYDATTGEFR